MTTSTSRRNPDLNSSMSPALARADSFGSSAAWTARKRNSGTRATIRPTWKSPTSASSDGVASSWTATTGMLGSVWAMAEPNRSHPRAVDSSDHEASGPGVTRLRWPRSAKASGDQRGHPEDHPVGPGDLDPDDREADTEDEAHDAVGADEHRVRAEPGQAREAAPGQMGHVEGDVADEQPDQEQPVVAEELVDHERPEGQGHHDQPRDQDRRPAPRPFCSTGPVPRPSARRAATARLTSCSSGRKKPGPDQEDHRPQHRQRGVLVLGAEHPGGDHEEPVGTQAVDEQTDTRPPGCPRGEGWPGGPDSALHVRTRRPIDGSRPARPAGVTRGAWRAGPHVRRSITRWRSAATSASVRVRSRAWKRSR